MKPEPQILTEFVTDEYTFDVGYGPQKFSGASMEHIIRYLNLITQPETVENQRICVRGIVMQSWLAADARMVILNRNRRVDLRELMKFDGFQQFIDAN